MEDDHVSDMYGNDGDDGQPGPTNDGIRLRKNGVLTEVKVAGERLTVVDPSVVQALERTVVELRSRIRLLEQDVRTLSSTLRQSTDMLKSVRSELERKVSYE